MLILNSLSKRSTLILFFKESRGRWEPDKNGFVEWTCERHLEIISRDARGSTVKRIGYRTKCSVSEEEAGLLTASNGGGTTTIESSSICVNFCAYRGRFFLFSKGVGKWKLKLVFS
jgi:hypothetical protein